MDVSSNPFVPDNPKIATRAYYYLVPIVLLVNLNPSIDLRESLISIVDNLQAPRRGVFLQQPVPRNKTAISTIALFSPERAYFRGAVYQFRAPNSGIRRNGKKKRSETNQLPLAVLFLSERAALTHARSETGHTGAPRALIQI